MSTLTKLLEEDPTGYDVEYRVHAVRRMFEREITNEDVEQVLRTGEIIERYDDDLPLCRALVSGRARVRRALHVVVVANLSERRLSVVSLYEPDPFKWSGKFSRRRR